MRETVKVWLDMKSLTVLDFVNEPVAFTKNTFPPPGPVSPRTQRPPCAHVGAAIADGEKMRDEKSAAIQSRSEGRARLIVMT